MNQKYRVITDSLVFILSFFIVSSATVILVTAYIKYILWLVGVVV